MTIVTNPCATDQQDEWPNYASEHGSDVTLVAGCSDVGGRCRRGSGSGESTPWRFPAHRRVLASAGGPLAALALTNDTVLYFSDVDKKAFDQVMRFLYGVPLQFTTALVARSTLDAAHKFKLPVLFDAAADALTNMLDPENLLVIVCDLRLYCGSEALAPERIRPTEPSAPPLSAIHTQEAPHTVGEQAVEAHMAQRCARLLSLALQAVDQHADRILQDERFSELSYGDAALIALRPNLCLTSEIDLALALKNWSTVAVRRSGRGDIPQHRRAALGELCYAPRYLLLSEKEFLQDVTPLEILDPTETALVLAALCGRSLDESAPEQRDLLQRLAEPRPNSKSKTPVCIDANNNGKKRKKKAKEADQTDKEDEGCCKCFGEGLLRTLLCLFD